MGAFVSMLGQPRATLRSDSTESERRGRRLAELIRALRSIDRPLAVIVDGLHLHDEISVGLWVDCVRYLDRLENGRASDPPESGGFDPSNTKPLRPIALVASYREEGTSAVLLRELSECLLRGRTGACLTLMPLGVEASRELADLATPAESSASSRESDWIGLELYDQTRGLPGAILAHVAGECSAPEGQESSARVEGASLPRSESERRLAETLAGLGRSAEARELARLADVRGDIESSLEALETGGFATKLEREDGLEWCASESTRAAWGALPQASRERVHRRIGEALASSGDPARRIDSVRHFLAAGVPPAVVEHGLAGAAYLRETLQHRASIDLFETVLDALPSRERIRRAEIVLEIAELRARVGDYDRSLLAVAASRRTQAKGTAARSSRLSTTASSIDCAIARGPATSASSKTSSHAGGWKAAIGSRSKMRWLPTTRRLRDSFPAVSSPANLSMPSRTGPRETSSSTTSAGSEPTRTRRPPSSVSDEDSSTGAASDCGFRCVRSEKHSDSGRRRESLRFEKLSDDESSTDRESTLRNADPRCPTAPGCERRRAGSPALRVPRGASSRPGGADDRSGPIWRGSSRSA